jgi:hypothetical protein
VPPLLSDASCPACGRLHRKDVKVFFISIDDVLSDPARFAFASQVTPSGVSATARASGSGSGCS